MALCKFGTSAIVLYLGKPSQLPGLFEKKYSRLAEKMRGKNLVTEYFHGNNIDVRVDFIWFLGYSVVSGYFWSN